MLGSIWTRRARKRQTSLRASALLTRSQPKLVARGGYGIFYGGFENSALLTYADFPFQFNLSFPNQVPNAPITFADGAIATIENGLTAYSTHVGGGRAGWRRVHRRRLQEQDAEHTGVQPDAAISTRGQRHPAGRIRGEHRASPGGVRNPNTPREILPRAWTRWRSRRIRIFRARRTRHLRATATTTACR